MAKNPADSLPVVDTGAPADPFAWDPDPTVLVSRRARRFHVPVVLFERPINDADRAAWKAAEAAMAEGKPTGVRPEAWVMAQAGVTFLGTWSTSWRDIQAQGPQQVSASPDMSRALLVQPISQGQNTIAANFRNKDQATGRLLPHAVRAVFDRVLEYIVAAHPDLFEAQDAYDAPEMMLLPLSEVFTQRTERGQAANAMITKAIPVLRRVMHETVTPLGVLHDYAIRHRGGGAVAIREACRAKAAKWGVK